MTEENPASVTEVDEEGVIAIPPALSPLREIADRTAHLRAAISREHGFLPDSAAVIREDRDARG